MYSAPMLDALLQQDPQNAERFHLSSPTVGYWSTAITPGNAIRAGSLLGKLSILGQRRELIAPADCPEGWLCTWDTRIAYPVDYGMRLGTLSIHASSTQRASVAQPTVSNTAQDDHEGQVFTAPFAGRFYRSATPDDPPFVHAGDTIAQGQVIGLLEAMKTFTRLQFTSSESATSVTLLQWRVENGDEVDQGSPLFDYRESTPKP